MKTVRKVPTEQEIEIGLRRLGRSRWRTIYARLVVYGLRAHEAFLGHQESNGLFVVPENTKTGERFVPPIQKEKTWMKMVAEPMPKVTAACNRIYGSRTWQAFRRSEVPFNPYDLRHRFVVITEELGIPPAIAANWAGHSCRTRYQVYTRTLDQRRALTYAHKHGFLLDQSHYKATDVGDAV